MMYLVLEYCDGGDLDAFLHKHGRLPEAVAKDLMRQLGTALIGIIIIKLYYNKYNYYYYYCCPLLTTTRCCYYYYYYYYYYYRYYLLLRGKGYLDLLLTLLDCFVCAAEGLKVLRGRNIVHRDLKPHALF